MNEFDTIEKYFLPLTCGYKGTAGLQDDAAVLSVPDGHELVVTSDTLNEGVHFLENTAPEFIAKKALRVNLSDLAAMGADPFCYQLNLAFPEKPSEEWLSAFSEALQDDNQRFGVFCSGGDTTSIKGGDLSISITAMGFVPKGQAVKRSGAQEGDVLIVTGSVGDAALGLRALQQDLDHYPEAVERYLSPCPRVQVVDIIRLYANAAADISDGLCADALNIALASGLGVEIDADKLDLSSDVKDALEREIVTLEDVLTAGDDYELILAISKENQGVIIRELQKKSLNPYVIGAFKSDVSKISILNTYPLRIDDKGFGWSHF